MKEKVEAALNEIRPMLQRDGGDVVLAPEIVTQGRHTTYRNAQ